MLSRDRNGLRHVEKAALPFDSRARTVTRAIIAVLVVLLAACGALAHANMNTSAWLLMPVGVVVVLAISLRRATAH